MLARLVACSFHARYLPLVTTNSGTRGRKVSFSTTTRSGSDSGSGRTSTSLTTEKMAAQAPIPRPSVTTATAVNPGALRSWRAAYPRSFMRPPRGATGVAHRRYLGYDETYGDAHGPPARSADLRRLPGDAG